jgi:beta-lactamase superfamily II metal-dependent hydrolase
MIKVEMLQAVNGDCFFIEYGESEESMHYILIDGGTSGTYKRLKKRLKSIPKEKRHLDLLVVTHIDADHIAGIIKLLEDETLSCSFDDIWFNGYQHLPGKQSRGVVQADRLNKILAQENLPWNKIFDGGSVCVDKSATFPKIELEGGMKLQILSPTENELKKLKPHWEKEAHKADIFIEHASSDSAEKQTSPRATVTQLPDVKSLANRAFSSDSSLTNGSSIAFIAEYDDKRMLFTGDAYATVLLESIKALKPNCQPLYLELFKVPHHGSDGNISQELLERVRCSRYLISTNGYRHKHPDMVAIARIIEYGGNLPELYFNYLTPYNQIWKNSLLQEKWRYSALYSTDNEATTLIL